MAAITSRFYLLRSVYGRQIITTTATTTPATTTKVVGLVARFSTMNENRGASGGRVIDHFMSSIQQCSAVSSSALLQSGSSFFSLPHRALCHFISTALSSLQPPLLTSTSSRITKTVGHKTPLHTSGCPQHACTTNQIQKVLTRKQTTSTNNNNNPKMSRTRVFFDMTADGVQVGRIIMEVYIYLFSSDLS